MLFGCPMNHDPGGVGRADVRHRVLTDDDFEPGRPVMLNDPDGMFGALRDNLRVEPEAWPILHDGPEPEYDPDEEYAREHADAWDGLE